MSPNKIIVTNSGALTKKYGAGVSKVQAAIAKLIKADATRGLITVMIALDNKNDMAAVGAGPVTKPTDPKQNKMAIDAVYNKYRPDYLMILGAVDVVPHQDLTNPLYSPATAAEDDPDPIVFSDLPYACPGAYGKKIAAFTNPTRVIGRLPDVTGGKDPNYLVTLINAASTFASRPSATYRTFFGVSAGVWTGSTTLSLSAAFGTSAGMKVVPPASSNWPQALLNAPSHFFNCHGAASSAQFYGQPASGADQYPVALDASYIAGKIKAGTVVAAECCYGAELYDPNVTGIHQGIPNQYLEDGAYGFFGSTTVAYGPSKTNDWADLLCQYFFESLLAGASAGRSVLQARQKYIANKNNLTGTDLKTLAQYILLGDPAVTPVASATLAPTAHRIMKKGAFVEAAPAVEASMQRSTRRQELIQNGLALGTSVSTSEIKSAERPGANIRKLLKNEAAKLGIGKPSFSSFAVQPAESLAAAKTLFFREGVAAKSVAFAKAVPLRELKAVHRAAGRTAEKNERSIGIVGVEIHEYNDGVTVHPFESR